MGVFGNSIPMPFSAAKQIVVEVAGDGSTESTLFTAAEQTAAALDCDVAFVQNDGAVTAYFTFSAAAEMVDPGGIVTSNDTVGQPILAGMGMSAFLTPLAKYVNASSDSGGAGTVLRVSLGKGQ